jgi:histone acetyltransferase (RNA polymerase elongator complex component)
MIVAEDIMKSYGLKKSAVIAGVGPREYYKNKCGYHLEGTYMVKELKQSYMYIWVILIFVILLI